MQEHIRVAHALFNFIYVKNGFSSLFFLLLNIYKSK